VAWRSGIRNEMYSGEKKEEFTHGLDVAERIEIGMRFLDLVAM
jgi:hypothetical protein